MDLLCCVIVLWIATIRHKTAGIWFSSCHSVLHEIYTLSLKISFHGTFNVWTRSNLSGNCAVCGGTFMAFARRKAAKIMAGNCHSILCVMCTFIWNLLQIVHGTFDRNNICLFSKGAHAAGHPWQTITHMHTCMVMQYRLDLWRYVRAI